MSTTEKTPHTSKNQNRSNPVKIGILHGVISFIFMFGAMTLLLADEPITQAHIIKGLIVWGIYGIAIGFVMMFLYKKYPYQKAQK